ncbi:MAG: hypothetical protein IJV29_07245 [Butyrivibrio sp.]|nr:hypothetical protein [Butyrivibrio sp.]
MIGNAIVVLCTLLIGGAVIWVAIEEHKAPDYSDEEKDNKLKENEEVKHE